MSWELPYRSTGQSLDEIAEIIAVAHERGGTVQMIASTAGACPYEGEMSADRVVPAAGRALADGADSASSGDTAGHAQRVRALAGAFRPAHPGDVAEPALPQHQGLARLRDRALTIILCTRAVREKSSMTPATKTHFSAPRSG